MVLKFSAFLAIEILLSVSKYLMSIKLVSRRDKSEKRVQSTKVGPRGLYLQEETHVFVMHLSLIENLTLKSSHRVRIFFEKMMKWV